MRSAPQGNKWQIRTSIHTVDRRFSGVHTDHNGNGDANLDDDFPLGDGTADTCADVSCPYCGEVVTIAVDAGGGSVQEYVEDCEVCCNPWVVKVRFVDGIADVIVTPLDE